MIGGSRLITGRKVPALNREDGHEDVGPLDT